MKTTKNTENISKCNLMGVRHKRKIVYKITKILSIYFCLLEIWYNIFSNVNSRNP